MSNGDAYQTRNINQNNMSMSMELASMSNGSLTTCTNNTKSDICTSNIKYVNITYKYKATFFRIANI